MRKRAEHRVRTSGQYQVIATILITVAVGCGRVAPDNQSSTKPGSHLPAFNHDGQDVPDPNWDVPFVNAVEVSNLGEAADRLSFAPVFPDDLGTPFRILVSNTAIEPNQRKLALLYDHPDYGRFNLIEKVSEITLIDLETQAAGCLPETGCSAEMDMVLMTNGIRALQIKGSVANSVIWLQGPLQFDVIGPSDTFPASSSLEIGLSVVAAS
jgi:hypothetical protein